MVVGQEAGIEECQVTERARPCPYCGKMRCGYLAVLDDFVKAERLRDIEWYMAHGLSHKGAAYWAGVQPRGLTSDERAFLLGLCARAQFPLRGVLLNDEQ